MEGSHAAGVQQALGGDRDAFRALVDRHSRSIFRLAYRMTGNEHDAEEVVPETFLRADRRLSKFESRAAHWDALHMNWHLLLPLGAVAETFAGVSASQWFNAKQLRKAFAVFIALLGAWMVAQNFRPTMGLW